jgi:hypothetical protein
MVCSLYLCANFVQNSYSIIQRTILLLLFGYQLTLAAKTSAWNLGITQAIPRAVALVLAVSLVDGPFKYL